LWIFFFTASMDTRVKHELEFRHT